MIFVVVGLGLGFFSKEFKVRRLGVVVWVREGLELVGEVFCFWVVILKGLGVEVGEGESRVGEVVVVSCMGC